MNRSAVNRMRNKAIGTSRKDARLDASFFLLRKALLRKIKYRIIRATQNIPTAIESVAPSVEAIIYRVYLLFLVFYIQHDSNK